MNTIAFLARTKSEIFLREKYKFSLLLFSIFMTEFVCTSLLILLTL